MHKLPRTTPIQKNIRNMIQNQLSLTNITFLNKVQSIQFMNKKQKSYYFTYCVFINKQLINLSPMNRRSHVLTPDNAKMESGVRKLEETIRFDDKLCAHENCRCEVCGGNFTNNKIKPFKSLFDLQEREKKKNWLWNILNGLTPQALPTIKMYVPDTFFVENDLVDTFSIDYRTYRLYKMPGTTPAKSLYSLMTRMRKNYKSILEEGFHRSMLDKIDPFSIHEKYVDQLLPSHFNSGEQSKKLMENRNCFRKYVLHKNEKYLIDSIEEHKMNEKQPFCFIKYDDSTSQLFTQKEFETFMIARLPNDINYIQGYIKQKQQVQSVFTTEYNINADLKDKESFERAERQILVLIGGLGKYSDDYEDLEVFEDTSHDLMMKNPQDYAQYTNYRIIHYLAMVSRIYVKHIKVNWILNDLGHVYLNQIFEFETTQICLRPLKFRMPPREQNIELYKDKQLFTKLYKQLQFKREEKRNKFKSELVAPNKNKTVDIKQSDTSTNFTSLNVDNIKFKRQKKLPQIHQTIDNAKFGRYGRKVERNSFDMRNSVSVKKKPRLMNLNLFESYEGSKEKESIRRKEQFFKKSLKFRNQTALDKYNF